MKSFRYLLFLYLLLIHGLHLPVLTGQNPVKNNDRIVFSHEQGFYPLPFFLEMTNDLAGAVIRYTVDGSLPDKQSALYTGGFLLDHAMNTSAPLSMIPTTPEDAPDEWVWAAPRRVFPRGFVIRAQCFLGDMPVSPVFTKTYFFGYKPEEDFRLPVVSMVTDSLHLFDHHSGLYVPGYHWYSNPVWGHYYGYGNYHLRGDDWERPANMTFFGEDGRIAFQYNVGIRIHGGGSRSLPQKSLRVYARARYGAESFAYPFFPERDETGYRRIILRNGGQAFLGGLINDAVAHELVRNLDLENQDYRPVVLFINGEFWGLHNIRDRIDKYYLAYRAGANPGAIYLLTGPANTHDVKEGNNIHYQNMLRHIERHDISLPENYEMLAQMMEIPNFIDYHIAKQYLAVYDYPGNNIDFWRPRTAGGKWRWIFYDNDEAMINTDLNSIEHSTLEGGTEWPNPDWSTFLFRSLLKNNTFRELFVERYSWHLTHTFETERVIGIIDSLALNIEHMVSWQIGRWNYPESVGVWRNIIGRMKHFAGKRPCVVRSQLIDYFGLDETTFLPELCSTLVTGTSGSLLPDAGESMARFSVHPNPVLDGPVFLTYHGQRDVQVQVTISGVAGNIVYRNPVYFTPGKQLQLGMGFLPPGKYFIAVQSDDLTTDRFLLIGL